ncbi:MAG: diguanylate cyclase [Gemmatimonadaceae bacterium]
MTVRAINGPNTPASGPGEPTRLTALVIEDNPEDVRPLRAALEQHINGARGSSFRVVHADRLVTGLQRLAQEHVDIVLLDLMLPDSRGLKTLGHIQRQTPSIPIVVMVALDDESLGIQAVQRGAQDYLVKGQLGPSLVARALRYAIERQQLHVTLRQLSLTDNLTGLYNRHGFQTLSEHHLKLAPRTRGLLLVSADLGGIDAVVTAHGRVEADRALAQTADILRATFRASDIIARLGDDRFAVLVLDAADESAEIISSRLHQRLAAFNARTKRACALSLDTAIARYQPHETPTVANLLALAERASAARLPAPPRLQSAG